MPKVGMTATHKSQLIKATMDVIKSIGLSRANMQLINPYFNGKLGLIKAALP